MPGPPDLSSAPMTAPIGAAMDRTSPRTRARMAGLLYVLIIIGGAWAQLGVRDRLIVGGNPALTAQNIAAHEGAYRLGFSVEVLYLLLLVPLIYLLHDLFGVVHRRWALLMALFATIGGAVQAVILLAHYAPLILLADSPALAAWSVEQRQAAALVALRLFDYGYMVALAFFGCFCLILGQLILRATFFPRFIGALLLIEGALYLLNSFGHFLAPAFGARVFPFLLASGVAEVSFGLGLLLLGVNDARWRAQAGAPGPNFPSLHGVSA